MPHLADVTLEYSPLNKPRDIVKPSLGVLSAPRRQKVVIYGAGRGHQFAPLDDDSWDVWNLNLIPAFDSQNRVRCDLWWDIHQRSAQTKNDLRWIEKCPVPIFVPDDLLDGGKNCVRFPIEDVVSRVTDGPFACTFAYQIAYALAEGYTDIGMYGVEVAYGTPRERTVEWASINWWMGYAEAKGMRFHLPEFSRLGTHPKRYGLDYKAEIQDVDEYIGYIRNVDTETERYKQLRASVGG